jgi:hypothetical protein
MKASKIGDPFNGRIREANQSFISPWIQLVEFLHHGNTQIRQIGRDPSRSGSLNTQT